MDTNTIDSFGRLNLNQLYDVSGIINSLINAQTVSNNISSFVRLKEDFIGIQLSLDLQDCLWKRLEDSSHMPSKPNKVRYLWYSKSLGCYRFTGHQNLETLPFLLEDPLLTVLNMINATLPRAQWLDSCLLAFYSSGELGVEFHADDEVFINQSCPIVNLSLSSKDASRDILFKSKKGPEKESARLTLNNGSLLTMEPGCQDRFLHSVPPQALHDGRRIVLSYRKATDHALIDRQHEVLQRSKARASSPTPAKKPRRDSQRNLPQPPPLHPLPTPKNNPITQVSSSPKPPLTLILGTSITVDLDLGPNSLNLSKRGATLPDLTQIIKEYGQTCIDTPEKIVIHGGTKDLLKRSTTKAQKLKPVLEELLKTTKELYPSAKVLFVSMLPIDAEKRCQNNRVPPQDIPLVPGKVLAFNRLARYLCKVHRVYHVHALKSFLSRDGDSIDPTLFNDHIHLSHKGTSVMNSLVNHHLNRLSKPARINPTPRTPMSLMVKAPPPAPSTPMLLDPSPEKLSESTTPNPAPTPTPTSPSNVSSEVEINYPPAAASSPSQSCKRGSSDTPPKSLTMSILEKIGVSSILAPDPKSKPD